MKNNSERSDNNNALWFREIPVYRSKKSEEISGVMKVNTNDFEKINQHKWIYVYEDGKNNRPYRWEKINGKYCKLQVHRVILGLEYGDPQTIRYKDGDVLNNTRKNFEYSFERNINKTISTRGFKWPKDIEQLKNFFETRNEEAYDCLSDAIKSSYNRKEIILHFDDQSPYAKDIQKTKILIRKALSEFFDLWRGAIEIAITRKDIMNQLKAEKAEKEKQQEKLEKKIQQAQGQKEHQLLKEKIKKSIEVNNMDNSNKVANVLINNSSNTATIRKELTILAYRNRDFIRELLNDRNIVHMEDLVYAVRVRGATAVSF